MQRHEFPALLLFILHSHSMRCSEGYFFIIVCSIIFFPHFLQAMNHFHRSFYRRTKQQRIKEHAVKAKQFSVLFWTRWKCHVNQVYVLAHLHTSAAKEWTSDTKLSHRKKINNFLHASNELNTVRCGCTYRIAE